MSLNVTSNIGVIGYKYENKNTDGFVAVATDYSAYSTDGINWTEGAISSTNNYWQSVCYGNGKFVAVFNTSKYYAYSTDGINWIEATFSDVSLSLNLCYGNGKFIAISATSNASNNSISIYNSTDGINWSSATDISELSYDVLELITESFVIGDITDVCLCYGNGKYVGITNLYSIVMYSTDGLTWTVGTISGTSRNWNSVCYGNDKFVAVARDSNYFAYSTDGITWTEGTISDTDRDWWSVCYGNDKFVAVARNSNYFAYSTDGINWTEGTISDSTRSWQSVCYGNGKFVAVASNNSNYFAYSTDGINWTEGTISDTSRSWDSVCFGVINTSVDISEKAFNLSQPENASTTEFSDKVILDAIVHHDSPMYLLINQKDTNNSFYIHSPNLGDLELPGNDHKIYPVDSNMNRNCIGGKLHPLGNGYVAYSVYSNNMSDTTPTSKQSDTDTGKLELITGVIKANPYLGYYKAVNGINFYGIENDIDEFLVPYREIDGKFVAVSNGSNYSAYSTDGITWTVTSNGLTKRTWRSICYGNGKFVAVASNTNYFAYSTDGMNWTKSTISKTSRNWCSVCYGNGKFVVIEGAGYRSKYFAYSMDGMDWTEGTLPSSETWTSVCYGNDKFVVVAGGDKYSTCFAYSIDGITWTKGTMSSDTYRGWNSVCYGNGKFVTVDYSGYFAYSTDGINWTKGTISNTSRDWRSVCYGNGKFVAVANQSNYFAYSTDGINWTLGTISDTSRNWWSVCYGNGKFVAVNINSNYYAYSTDGITWTKGTIRNTNNGWMAICYASIPNIEFSNDHTGISSDVTDINGVSTMTTYTEQYSDDIYYIHYAWVDRASSSLVRYNILTRKIDTSGDKPVISNLTSYTTTFSIGTIAHPSFHKDKNGIHCAFYHGSTAYTKYYKLTRSGTDDSTWSWGTDSNTYITNENVSLMTNYTSDNIQSPMAQSARRMYMVNSDGNLVEFKKTQTF